MSNAHIAWDNHNLFQFCGHHLGGVYTTAANLNAIAGVVVSLRISNFPPGAVAAAAALGL